MKHLGDITKLKGYAIPPVDCIIGGSPCQDLSIAGRRAGLAGERSGLFMEQIRLVKEMRVFYGKPRFMVWENVPGAFSSNGGQDFKAVLEEVIKVAEPQAPDIPFPDKAKWPLADCWLGADWSIAYRVLDAQFWGVPQRRRRIALVADFRGFTAPEILFERKSLSGDFEQGETQRQNDTASTGSSVNCTDRKQLTCIPIIENKIFSQQSFGEYAESNVSPVLRNSGGDYGGGSESLVVDSHNTHTNAVVRRLTPLECERLQGYPDGWTDIGEWTDNKGKLHKESSDTARYKALGNSIALPPWTWVLTRLCRYLKLGATLGSLFDDIGGFPLIWERINGSGSCLWASEIEDFPIAVTTRRFYQV